MYNTVTTCLQLLFTYLLHLQTLIFIHNWLKKFGCSYFLPIAPTSCWFCQRSVPQLVRFNQRILFLQRKAHLFNLRAFSHVYFLWRCHVSLVLHNSFLLFHWPTSPCARCLCASMGIYPAFLSQFLRPKKALTRCSGWPFSRGVLFVANLFGSHVKLQFCSIRKRSRSMMQADTRSYA